MHHLLEVDLSQVLRSSFDSIVLENVASMPNFACNRCHQQKPNCDFFVCSVVSTLRCHTAGLRFASELRQDLLNLSSFRGR